MCRFSDSQTAWVGPEGVGGRGPDPLENHKRYVSIGIRIRDPLGKLVTQKHISFPVFHGIRLYSLRNFVKGIPL